MSGDIQATCGGGHELQAVLFLPVYEQFEDQEFFGGKGQGAGVWARHESSLTLK
jgi:hypothetical protein